MASLISTGNSASFGQAWQQGGGNPQGRIPSQPGLFDLLRQSGQGVPAWSRSAPPTDQNNQSFPGWSRPAPPIGQNNRELNPVYAQKVFEDRIRALEVKVAHLEAQAEQQQNLLQAINDNVQWTKKWAEAATGLHLQLQQDMSKMAQAIADLQVQVSHDTDAGNQMLGLLKHLVP